MSTVTMKSYILFPVLAGFLTLLVCLAGPTRGSQQANRPDWMQKQREEDILVRRITEKGVESSRFRLSDIQPRGGRSARVTIRGCKSATPLGTAYDKTPILLYPKDKLPDRISTTAGGYEWWPTGSGSIWCLQGEYGPGIGDYTFFGEESDPLTFILLDKIGLVYLHGKGKVFLPDGKEVALGYHALPVPEHDSDILEVQRRLTELGYNPGPIDGVWGKKTQAAIREFQRNNGLPVTGRLDEETKKRLAFSESAEDITSLANDCLIIVLFIINDRPSEWRQLAEPVIDKYHLGDVRTTGLLTPEGFQVVLTTSGMAVKFGSGWADPLSGLFVGKPGDFPPLRFRSGSASIRQELGGYELRVGDGTEVQLGNRTYRFRDGTWQLAD